MIHALLFALLVTATPDGHPSRPKPAPAKKTAPRPPPPPVEEDEPLDLPDDGLHDHDDFDPPASPKPTGDDDLDGWRGHGAKRSEKELQAIGAAGLCCCFLFAVGLIAFIVWLVKRATTPAQKAAPTAAAPPPAGPAAASAGQRFHLSVVAVGMHATARQLVAQQLLLAGVQADPVSAAERTQLVRELAKAVRGLETEWTHFGYGERLDLADELAAQSSYQRAVEDFGGRSNLPASGESSYAVMTLVLCTRRQLRGVSALDDRAQIRALLDERVAISEPELMGAYLTWSPALGGHEVLSRYPEMHAVR